MTFFRSYFDESGKFKDHRVISFCGVMASPDSLKAFVDVWESCLRRCGLVSLHTSHALRCTRALSPTIRSQTPAERCETLRPFVECILDHLDLGVGIVFDVEGYSKWAPGAKKRVGGSDDPAYLAFLQATQAIKVHACRDDDRVSMMCDDDTDTALNFYQLYRQVKKIDIELKKKLVALSFGNDEAYPGLQAADFIAGLLRLESLRIFGYHKHEFGPLIESLLKPRASQKLKWIGLVGDRHKLGDMGEEMANSHRAKASALSRKLKKRK